MEKRCDYLIIGSGLAGLATALKLADLGQVWILAKTKGSDSNTEMAQGGIAAVISEADSFDQHVGDTINAGGGLCKPEVVKQIVQQGPQRIADLVHWGVQFDVRNSNSQNHAERMNIALMDLTREGGHSQRRILHVEDHTGREIERALLARIEEHQNISILQNHFAIDLITNRNARPNEIGPPRCLGAYVLDTLSGEVLPFLAKATVLATGGAGKIYLYTSNWQGSTGDGIAMASRTGARLANLEFIQFHPTCLYHQGARNYLISEALRGEGAELVNRAGNAFMKKYHAMGSLGPRDIVARGIDAELKKSGDDCVFLDLSAREASFWQERFPMIYQSCLKFGIDMPKDSIPVVPAAHYSCGGILTDLHGRTDIHGLLAVGETAATGLHGANRLASNSLLECLAIAHNAAEYLRQARDDFEFTANQVPQWQYTSSKDSDEMSVVNHLWDEIRRVMWNYVGILRSNKRLWRARDRLKNIRAEIKEYYWDFALHPDLLELRNLALVAELTVQSALARKQSVGVHCNIDYPFAGAEEPLRDTVVYSPPPSSSGKRH